MSERLTQALSAAVRHVQVAYDEGELERGVARLGKAIARRRRAKQAALAACALLVGSGALLVRGPADDPLVVATHDGSVARRASADVALTVLADEPERVELELAAGRSHFEVTPNRRRRYRVHAGSVDVEVLGTAFDVARRGSGAEVHVDHGLVRVRWPFGEALLRAGEGGAFPPALPRAPAVPAASPPSAVEVTTTPVEDAPAAHTQPDIPAPARERWRSLARAGKHAEAFSSLGMHVVDDLSGLLLAADAARLSGHPREAARHLERLVARHGRSAEAPLAAFTLGRLCLHELGEPKRAAAAFARAYALAPNGPLAEDALAREAEAYHRAGDHTEARSVAQQYLARFPHGARRAELARY